MEQSNQRINHKHKSVTQVLIQLVKICFISFLFALRKSCSLHTLKGFYSNYHQNKSREQLKINLTDFYSKLETQNIKPEI